MTKKDWRAELDAMNEVMRKKKTGTDTQIIAANDRVKNEEYRKNLSKALKGRIRTEEEIQKWRESYDGNGEKNGMFGKKHSADTIKKISEACKGGVGRTGPQTEETKIKMRKPRSEAGKANMRKPKLQKICPVCGFVGAGGIMLRWHFDNCKHK